MYGPESRNPGSYAASCLLARRLVQRGVRFVQLYHRGWGDLARHGLLEDTLVIWYGKRVPRAGQLPSRRKSI